MSKIISRQGNVITVDFSRKSKPRSSLPKQLTGVFIKPMGASESMYTLKGNVSGFIASYIAFHPDFSPSLFGAQVREELGVIVGNDPEPPSAA